MTFKKIINGYLLKYPKEKKALGSLNQLIAKYLNDEELISRKNPAGHITSSAIIVSRKTHRMLKIYHGALKKYLQPGGHIQSMSEGPLDSAIKKLKNDGIIQSVFFEPVSKNKLIPLDIDTHLIPFDKKFNVPEHWHHDFRYLFVCEDEFNINNKDSKWEDLPSLTKEGTFVNLIDKIQFLWSKEHEEKLFYNSIVEGITLRTKINFIVIQHFLPGVEHFLTSLKSLGTIVAVIPKPKSIKKEIFKRLRKEYNVVKLKARDELSSDSRIKEIIANSENPVILIDIGGWFAPHIEEYSKKFPKKIIGVVEDTENGHQKYHKLKKWPCPIISVARSPLKQNEDTLIGQSIVFSADSILRTQNKLIKYMTCGVLGYGKVGKSIAFDLITKSIKPIVYDKDPVKLIMAYNDGCSIGSKEKVLRSSDAIFCATGNKSIEVPDLLMLRQGGYLFSVTSADDEFKFSDIEDNYTCEEISEHVKRYYKFENSFYIVNNGDAVNFIHNAVVGDFIHLVKAEMLQAINMLCTKRPNNKMHAVSSLAKKEVSEKWLKCFQNINN